MMTDQEADAIVARIVRHIPDAMPGERIIELAVGLIGLGTVRETTRNSPTAAAQSLLTAIGIIRDLQLDTLRAARTATKTTGATNDQQ